MDNKPTEKEENLKYEWSSDSWDEESEIGEERETDVDSVFLVSSEEDYDLE